MNMLLILVLLKLASAGGDDEDDGPRFGRCEERGGSCSVDTDCCDEGTINNVEPGWCNLEEPYDFGVREAPGTCRLFVEPEELSTCQRCRRLCHHGEQCWNGGDNQEWCEDNCGVNECSCSCTHCQPTEISGYEALSPGCVIGENIQLYSGKTVQQCGDLCDAQNGVGAPCVGFEIFANHGGDKENFNWGNCQLSSSTNTQGCHAESYNLDFYTKVVTVTDPNCIPGKNCAMSKTQSAVAAVSDSTEKFAAHSYEDVVVYGFTLIGVGVVVYKVSHMFGSKKEDYDVVKSDQEEH